MLYPLLLAAALAPQDAATPAVEVEVIQTSAEFDATMDAGDPARGAALIEPAIKACIAETGGADATPAARQRCVLLFASWASALSEAGRSVDAVPIAHHAVAIAESFAGEERQAYLMITHFTLALVLERQGQHLAAAPSFVLALEVAEAVLADEAAVAAYVARRANNLIALARFAEALPLTERALRLAGDTANGAFFRLMHGKALMGLGRLGEAEASLRTGADRLVALAGVDTPQAIAVRETLAWCLNEQNRPEEALVIVRATLATQRARQAGPLVADSLTMLGVTAMQSGDLREAETAFREALAIRLRYFGETSNFTALAYSNVGHVLVEAGRYDDSAWMFNRAITVWQASGGGNAEEFVAILSNMASVLSRVRALEQAEPLQRQALGIAESALGQGHIRTVLIRNNLAAILARMGRRADALALLETNYAAAVALGAQGGQMRTLAATSMAQLCDEEGDRAAARLWFERAEAAAREAFRSDHPQRINLGWSYGRALLRDPAAMPLARTLLRDAGRQALGRAGKASSFDVGALDELNGFTAIFRDQVRAAWSLSRPRS